MTNKQHKINSIKQWIVAAEKGVGASYCLTKLASQGIIAEDVLKTMNEKQLKIALSLCAMAFTHGADSTRKHIGSLRGRKEVPASSHLKVVS